jgi:hypothetical protein
LAEIPSGRAIRRDRRREKSKTEKRESASASGMMRGETGREKSVAKKGRR